MDWRLRLSDKTVRKCAELPTVSDTNVAQERSFLQCKVYADIRGGSLERARQMRVVIVENGDFRFMRSLSYGHITYMATRQLSGDTTVNDLGIF